MYDYDRRKADARPRSYVDVVNHAEKMLGIKRGLEARVRDLKVDARALDQDWRQHNELGDDDDWARLPRLQAQWKKLQKAFSYCFGYDPPALGKV